MAVSATPRRMNVRRRVSGSNGSGVRWSFVAMLLALVFALAAVAAGCGGDDDDESSNGDTGAAAGDGDGACDKSIWVLLPDSATSPRWETDDRPYFDDAFTEAGVEHTIVNAEGDATTQQSQAEQ